MSGLTPAPSPALLSLPNTLQRTPAWVRAEALQGTSPLARESLVAARPVAAAIEKKFLGITLAVSLTVSGSSGFRLLTRSR